MTCLDTSFIIDVLRGNPEINKIEKALEVSSKPVNVTTVTIMEVSRGIHLSNFPEIEKIKVHKLLSSLNILNFDKSDILLCVMAFLFILMFSVTKSLNQFT